MVGRSVDVIQITLLPNANLEPKDGVTDFPVPCAFSGKCANGVYRWASEFTNPVL